MRAGAGAGVGGVKSWFQHKHLMRKWHTLLRMTQEVTMDTVVRQRIKGLRLAKGWSLDALAARCYLSASTLSRIETGHRRIALDQLVPLAKALGTTLDQLVEPTADEDVVIRPEPEHQSGITTWLLSREHSHDGRAVAKMRITQERSVENRELSVHPGREWFTVLTGTVSLLLGERTILVHEGQAAEFSTMVPHRIGAHRGPVEILTIFDREGERAHLPGSHATAHEH